MAAALLVLLSWLGFLALDPFRPGLTLTGNHLRYLPSDAHREDATFRLSSSGEQDDRAMVENTRWSGPLGQQIPLTMQGWLNEVPQPKQWWRESIKAPGQNSWRLRLRTLGDDGVRLQGQSWERRGMVFDPALLELPNDVAPGRTWRSDGYAATSQREQDIVSYHNESTAVPAPAAGTDCLRVSSATRLAPTVPPEKGGPEPIQHTWTEHSTWCPGRGIVAQEGSTDQQGSSMQWQLGPGEPPERLPDRLFQQLTPLVGDPAGWRRGTIAPVSGDDSFGLAPVPHLVAQQTTVTSQDRQVTLANNTLLWSSGLRPEPGAPPDEIQLLGHDWSRPGGVVLQLSSIGALAVASTTERQLVAYAPAGRAVWSHGLDEVAVAAPSPVGPDRLAVATLAGTVTLLDARDGRPIWTHDIGAAVTKPIAVGPAGELAVLDEENRLTLLGPDGSRRWQQDLTDRPTALGIGTDRILVGGYSGLTSIDPGSGRVLRSEPFHGGVTRIQGAPHGFAIQNEFSLTLLSPDGTRRATLPAASSVVPGPDGWFAAQGPTLSLLSADGKSRHSWTSDDLQPITLFSTGATIWCLHIKDAVTITGAWWIGEAP